MLCSCCRLERQTIVWLRQSPSYIFSVVEGWSAWLQEGSLPNSFSRGLRLHGWPSTGSLPLGPAAEATIYVSSLTILLRRFLLSRWYHVASLCLQAFFFFFFFFFAACLCMRGSEAVAALAADAGNQYIGKQWKIREGCGPPISSPKIEVRGGKNGSLQRFQAPGAECCSRPLRDSRGGVERRRPMRAQALMCMWV